MWMFWFGYIKNNIKKIQQSLVFHSKLLAFIWRKKKVYTKEKFKKNNKNPTLQLFSKETNKDTSSFQTYIDNNIRFQLYQLRQLLFHFHHNLRYMLNLKFLKAYLFFQQHDEVLLHLMGPVFI